MWQAPLRKTDLSPNPSWVLKSLWLWHLLTQERRTLEEVACPTLPLGGPELPAWDPLGLTSNVAWLAGDQDGAIWSVKLQIPHFRDMVLGEDT